MSRDHIGPRAAFFSYTGQNPGKEILKALDSLLESGSTYVEARDVIEALRELPPGSRGAAISLMRQVRRKQSPDSAVSVAKSRLSMESPGVNDSPDGGSGSPSEVLLALSAASEHSPSRRVLMTELVRSVARKRFPGVALSRIASRVDQEPDS